MFKRRFPVKCSILLKTGDRVKNRALSLRSIGYLEFAVAGRSDSSIVDLRLVDAEANVQPFHADVDGERVDIEGFTITARDFDLSASEGEVDQATEEGWFRLAFTLRTELAPRLRELLGIDSIQMEIVERGTISVSREMIIETHAETFELPESVPRSLVEGIGRFREVDNSKGPPCKVSSVRLGAVISEEFSRHDEKELSRTQMDLIVCPGTKVTLVYAITDVSAVNSAVIKDIKNGADIPVSSLDPSGTGTIDITPTDDAEYVLSISDPSCAPDSAPGIKIWVVKPGKEIDIAAGWNGQAGVATWDGSPKFIGKDVYATSIRSVDCGIEQRPPIPDWGFMFTDMDGRVSFGEVGPSYAPLPRGDLPLHGSRWTFEPKSYVRDILRACFSIRCACR